MSSLHRMLVVGLSFRQLWTLNVTIAVAKSIEIHDESKNSK